MLRRASLVLCDEVTASIDYQTDKLVQETLRSSPALRDATVLTVAHRLRTIADSDLVVVLDAGRLVEVRICCSCICHQLSLSVVVCRRLSSSATYKRIYYTRSEPKHKIQSQPSHILSTSFSHSGLTSYLSLSRILFRSFFAG